MRCEPVDLTSSTEVCALQTSRASWIAGPLRKGNPGFLHACFTPFVVLPEQGELFLA